jgi:hypothetical protein
MAAISGNENSIVQSIAKPNRAPGCHTTGIVVGRAGNQTGTEARKQILALARWRWRQAALLSDISDIPWFPYKRTPDKSHLI